MTSEASETTQQNMTSDARRSKMTSEATPQKMTSEVIETTQWKMTSEASETTQQNMTSDARRFKITHETTPQKMTSEVIETTQWKMTSEASETTQQNMTSDARRSKITSEATQQKMTSEASEKTQQNMTSDARRSKMTPDVTEASKVKVDEDILSLVHQTVLTMSQGETDTKRDVLDVQVVAQLIQAERDRCRKRLDDSINEINKQHRTLLATRSSLQQLVNSVYPSPSRPGSVETPNHSSCDLINKLSSYVREAKSAKQRKILGQHCEVFRLQEELKNACEDREELAHNVAASQKEIAWLQRELMSVKQKLEKLRGIVKNYNEACSSSFHLSEVYPQNVVVTDTKSGKFTRERTYHEGEQTLADMTPREAFTLIKDRGRILCDLQNKGRQLIDLQDRGRQLHDLQDRGRQLTDLQNRGRQLTDLQDRGRQLSNLQDRGRQLTDLEDHFRPLTNVPLNIKAGIGKCLRCQTIFRSNENSNMACRFHRKGREITECYNNQGKLLRVVYKWACCKKPLDTAGCSHGYHI